MHRFPSSPSSLETLNPHNIKACQARRYIPQSSYCAIKIFCTVTKRANYADEESSGFHCLNNGFQGPKRAWKQEATHDSRSVKSLPQQVTLWGGFEWNQSSGNAWWWWRSLWVRPRNRWIYPIQMPRCFDSAVFHLCRRCSRRPGLQRMIWHPAVPETGVK